jgi:excisionase family DNA binding protein
MGRESVSIAEAAKLFSVSRWTIRRLIRAGDLPAFLVGRCLRIAISDLQTFRRTHRVEGAASSRT